MSSHLRSLGLVLAIEELGQSSSLDLMDADREKGKTRMRSGFSCF